MGKASSAKQSESRREKIAAQRDAARRMGQRHRLLLAAGAVLAVIAVVAVLVVVKLNSKPSPSAGHAAAGPTGAALGRLIASTTSVPAATFETVGKGKLTSRPLSIAGHPPALTNSDKPEILYMGAEFCPYCAAERWPLVVALGRFGTFTGLRATHSAITSGNGAPEPFPDTKTWSFYGSSYHSSRLAFTAVEMNSNVPDPRTGGYATLQTATPQQQALLTRYDGPPYTSAQNAGSIPFVNMGNRYLVIGASFNAGILQGLSWNQIAARLHSPSTPVAQAVLGAANYITAGLCRLTGERPGDVCTSAISALRREM